jgi:CubicO group peptidase (beta-lactamase class C family)
MKSLALVVGSVLIGSPLTAQAVQRPISTLDGRHLTPRVVDTTVANAMTRERVPGLAIAIIERGEIVYLRAFGERNTVTHEPLTTHSTLYAASFTKTMFARLVLQLVDDGKLDLDRPVIDYTGPIDTVEKWSDLASDPRYRKITARMLLSHTSGFANFRFLNPDRKLHILFEPGSRYAYSGEGLNLLQFVVEKITGASLTTLMHDRVFLPLGMTHTSMVWDSTFAADLAMGHDTAGTMIGHSRRSSPRAAGSADTNIEDLARYMLAVLRGTGLSAQSHRAMFSPQIRIHSQHQFPTLDTSTTTRDDNVALSYGLGWGLIQTRYGRGFFKEGTDDITRNHMVGFTDSQRGMVVMTNSGRGDRLFALLFARLLGDRYSPWAWNGLTPVR